jgi:hypothetical protein
MNDFLKKALPWIGAAATGNVPALVAMAASQLSQSFGTDIAPTADAIVKAVQGATPEQMMAMKQADNDFSAKMQAMGFAHLEELQQVAANDRADARNREIKTGDSWTPRLLAAMVLIGWLAVQGFLLTHVVDATMRELVTRVLGTLDGALMLVLSYYFGSSAGSAEKNQIMAQNPQGRIAQ